MIRSTCAEDCRYLALSYLHAHTLKSCFLSFFQRWCAESFPWEASIPLQNKKTSKNKRCEDTSILLPRKLTPEWMYWRFLGLVGHISLPQILWILLAMAVELCLLLLLLFCGSTVSEVQPIYKPPPGTLDFGFVPAKTYDTGAYHEPGPIGILFKIVHAFLYLVQPNPFPQGKSINIFVDFMFRSVIGTKTIIWKYVIARAWLLAYGVTWECVQFLTNNTFFCYA